DGGDITGPPFGLDSVITPNLFPGVSISADLGNGPGIQEVATFSVDVAGPEGGVAVSNAHGTVTGAAGQEVATFSVDVAGPEGGVAVSNAHGTVTGAAGGVLLRPFARLIASTGDSVTTYGEPWNMN
ncbi:MspA family porin, partial [Mycolicibacterium thermoresistibile]|uniref:MspA family porin n=1 Tax=Mycolicibacterium thermoresistibile TaxID=1797 RepID=UPI0021F387EE